MSALPSIRVGTAGWSIPRASAPRFPGEGTHLERYARWLRCAEINSSFYRPHSHATYARWRARTPPDFRFSVKMPKVITHELKLRQTDDHVAAFLQQTDGLAEKRGPILVQLPPSLAFDPVVVAPFFEVLRRRYDGAVVCEPRHATWFAPEAAALLERYLIGRVAADPPPTPAALQPGAGAPVAYFRLHGSPRMYWSKYDEAFMAPLAVTVRAIAHAEVWCVFDNTASGAAIDNALDLTERIGR